MLDRTTITRQWRTFAPIVYVIPVAVLKMSGRPPKVTNRDDSRRSDVNNHKTIGNIARTATSCWPGQSQSRRQVPGGLRARHRPPPHQEGGGNYLPSAPLRPGNFVSSLYAHVCRPHAHQAYSFRLLPSLLFLLLAKYTGAAYTRSCSWFEPAPANPRCPSVVTTGDG